VRRSILPVALLLSMLAAPASWADYRDSYRDGITAAENGDWSEVRQLMQGAIAENPTDSRKKVKLYGTRFKEYIPNFYLGLALYHLGDCAGAIRSFDTSERQGAIQRTGEYRDLTRLREECRGRQPVRPAASPTQRPPSPTPTAAPATATVVPTAIPPTATPRRAVPTPRGQDPQLTRALGQAETAITDAGRAESTVRRLAGDARYDAAWLATADAARQRDEAFRLLDQARQQLDAGRRSGDVAELDQAASLAQRANNMLASLPARLEAARKTASSAEPTRDTPTPRPPPRPTATPAPTVPVLPPADTTVPESLTEAVDALLAGEHERVIGLLDGARFANRRVSAVAHMVRAAARWTLFRRSATDAAALREQAETDVRDCRRLDDGVRPDNQAFSPAFVTFFDSVR
jgi:hypothetical protein